MIYSKGLRSDHTGLINMNILTRMCFQSLYLRFCLSLSLISTLISQAVWIYHRLFKISNTLNKTIALRKSLRYVHQLWFHTARKRKLRRAEQYTTLLVFGNVSSAKSVFRGFFFFLNIFMCETHSYLLSLLVDYLHF